MKWRRGTLAVPFALAAMAVSVAGGAVSASAAAGDAYVRMTYLSPNGGNPVDFYVDGVRVWSGVKYLDTSTYTPFTAGQHDFVVRKSGAGASSTPLIDLKQSLTAGTNNTLFAGGKAGALAAVLFTDGFPSLPSGKAAARFVHMAPEVPAVDVAVVNGPTVFTNVSFLQGTPYAAVDPGSYHFQLLPTGAQTPTLFDAPIVTAKAGVIYTFVGAGGDGEPVALVADVDAGSAGVAPTGGAATGEGGLAYRAALPIGIVALGLLGSLVLLAFARRRPLVD